MNRLSPGSLLRQLGSFIQHNEKRLLAALAVIIVISGSLWYREYFNIDGDGPAAGGTYVDGIVGTSEDLDAVAAKLTKSGLFKVDRSGGVVNHLIDNWSVNADKTKYTFDLKPGINAQEIVDQINQNIELFGPTIVTDEGDGVITMALSTANPNLPLLLTQPLFDYGAFKLSKLSDTTAIFTRSTNENSLKPYVNKIVVHLFPDQVMLREAMEKKKINGGLLEGEDIPDGYQMFSYNTPNYFAVILNINRSPFRTGSFRRALVAGQDVKLTRVVLTVANEEPTKTLAKQVKSQWEKQGLVVSMQLKSLEEITNKIGPTRDFEALLTGISYGAELDPFYLWHSSQIRPPGNNLSGVKSDDIDKAIIEIESDLSLANRDQKILQLHKKLESLGVVMIVERLQRNFVIDHTVVPAAPYLPLSQRDRWQAIDQWYLK